MNIIAAIDIIGGSCVRLSEGDYSRKTEYSADPLHIAKSFEEAGCTHLHIVDLDGARLGHLVNFPIIEKIATHTSLHIDVGGGIKSREDLQTLFSCGAKEATLGSIAAKDQKLTLSLLEEFGPNQLILGADCKNSMIAVGGWTESTSYTVEEFVFFYLEKGFRKIISTDISKDGMLSGPSFDLYEKLLKVSSSFDGSSIIASGGVHSLEDVKKLQSMNLGGVIIGKALYENFIKLDELSSYLKSIKGE